jgi:hypothetical protein
VVVAELSPEEYEPGAYTPSMAAEAAVEEGVEMYDDDGTDESVEMADEDGRLGQAGGFCCGAAFPRLGTLLRNKAAQLAAANDKRLQQLPEVPTFAESGYSGMEAGLWYGMLAPKGTPDAVVQRLNAAINQALKDPELRGRFAASSIEVIGSTPEEFGRYVGAEIKRWGEVARAAKIQLD